MSGVDGLAEIVLWAADVEVALEFYRDRLGLEPISPATMPNKFLRAGKAADGAIPQMVVLIPHPYPDDYFPAHKKKEQRTLHHLAFRVSPREYEALETRFIEAGIEVRHGTHPVLKNVRTFYVDDPDGNEVEIIAPV
jgi:catechol 2,3-dioxygenase-like lactoylglutathione lyase family enzyme